MINDEKLSAYLSEFFTISEKLTQIMTLEDNKVVTSAESTSSLEARREELSKNIQDRSDELGKPNPLLFYSPV